MEAFAKWTSDGVVMTRSWYRQWVLDILGLTS